MYGKGNIVAIDSNHGYASAQFVDPAMESTYFSVYRNVVKRVFDMFAVLLLAAPALIVLSVLSLVIILTGAVPFYSQRRIGKNGREFRMWKLRSMVPNAEARLEEYLAENPAAREEWDRTQKLKDDPRITPIGRFIRKSSLDELPQLLNVYIGDMSLVGPRPMMCEQRDLYPGKAYFQLSPGITGFWQISERNETSFAERAYYDTSYHQQLSWSTDMWVLLQTVSVVLRGTGY